MGRLCATRGVATLMEESAEFSAFVHQSLDRYIRCDWGDTCEEDWEQNDSAVRDGERILAMYENSKWRIWIITEWDRSVTTVLFPEEY